MTTTSTPTSENCSVDMTPTTDNSASSGKTRSRTRSSVSRNQRSKTAPIPIDNAVLNRPERVEQLMYQSCPNSISDHKPVRAAFKVTVKK
jgi:endonuclease/exonuclease/phosphatase family metal-dependent hydrolase